METPYDYNFIIELDENNKWLIENIKNEDKDIYSLLEKTRKNVFELLFRGILDTAEELIVKYKLLLVSAYPYYLTKYRREIK